MVSFTSLRPQVISRNYCMIGMSMIEGSKRGNSDAQVAHEGVTTHRSEEPVSRTTLRSCALCKNEFSHCVHSYLLVSCFNLLLPEFQLYGKRKSVDFVDSTRHRYIDQTTLADIYLFVCDHCTGCVRPILWQWQGRCLHCLPTAAPPHHYATETMLLTSHRRTSPYIDDATRATGPGRVPILIAASV
jgi:hypothetical protein